MCSLAVWKWSALRSGQHTTIGIVCYDYVMFRNPQSLDQLVDSSKDKHRSKYNVLFAKWEESIYNKVQVIVMSSEEHFILFLLLCCHEVGQNPAKNSLKWSLCFGNGRRGEICGTETGCNFALNCARVKYCASPW